jgi:hypothetical protein
MSYVIDKKYPHRRLMRAGARLIYYREPACKYFDTGKFLPARWQLFVHIDSDNGDGGVLFRFTRSGRRWKCDGWGLMRYAFNPGREVFADKLPNFPPVQVVRDGGKWWLVDKASGEKIREYIPKGGAA